MAERCTENYLPWLLAHDFNFAPFDSLKSELDDLGGDEFMILLASEQESTNILIIYDQSWENG